MPKRHWYRCFDCEEPILKRGPGRPPKRCDPCAAEHTAKVQAERTRRLRAQRPKPVCQSCRDEYDRRPGPHKFCLRCQLDINDGLTVQEARLKRFEEKPRHERARYMAEARIAREKRRRERREQNEAAMAAEQAAQAEERGEWGRYQHALRRNPDPEPQDSPDDELG